MKSFRFIDLFCGIGGFRIAAETLGWQCVFSSDIDPPARQQYNANFGDEPVGDIRLVKESEVPDHDILFAGFPCQPFSIIGAMNGLDDSRGTLFYEIGRILAAKSPNWFVLENVKQLAGHKRGETLEKILSIASELGYSTDWRILNALDFGLPQKRERVFIVGNNQGTKYDWPEPQQAMSPLSTILEPEPPSKFYASETIRLKRRQVHQPDCYPSIWHENKSGHISSYPFSCALRAGASYNYLLVNGERRLTPREMLRLQGFPESFQIVTNDAQVRKQAGNSVAIPVVEAILKQIAVSESEDYHAKTQIEKTAMGTTSVST